MTYYVLLKEEANNLKAIVYNGAEKLTLEDIDCPNPTSGELLIKVKSVGICGSDFEGYLGKTGRRTAPMVMGHEFSGVVEDSNKVNGFKNGDRVVVQPKLYCGKCFFCNNELVHMCPNAEFLGVLSKNGGMAEYVSVPAKCVYKIFETTSFQEASMVEPLAVAYRAVSKVSKEELEKAKNVMLIGAGTIGLLALQLLKYKGAKNIIVSDLSDYRLNIAKDLGASSIINPGKEDLIKKVEKLTNGNMIDYSFEAVGISITAASSLNVLKRTGTAIWIGNAEKMIQIDMQKVVTNEISIHGTYIYTEKDFLASLEMIQNKELDLNSIISIQENLANGIEAFKVLQENRDGKIIKIILNN